MVSLPHLRGSLRTRVTTNACCLYLFLALVLIGASQVAVAQQFSYDSAYDFVTENALTTFQQQNGWCYAPTCVYLPSPGAGTGQVSTSDWAVGQTIWIYYAADGEQVTWAFTDPTGNKLPPFVTLIYNQSSGYFIEYVGSQLYGQYCSINWPFGFAAWGYINSCNQMTTPHEIGTWSLSTYDNGNVLFTNSFQISENSTGVLGITSPTPNQLYDLSQGNYNATGNVMFSAATSTGTPISWNVQLHYQSSGGYPNPATDPSPLTFQGTSYNYSGYPSIGGQVVAKAQVVAPDGSAVPDCVTFYVDGPQSGIPNSTITGRLNQLYTGSSDYSNPLYLNDGTATPNLMTGVACYESSYQQFRTPTENFNPPEPDLFNLNKNFQVTAKWPVENPPANCPDGSYGRGCYIGLMQVGPTTDPDAWDWTMNTQDGVNLFSGGSSSDKVQTAVKYEGCITSGCPYTFGGHRHTLPAHINGNGTNLVNLTGYQRENNALVLYGGWLTGCSPGDYSCYVTKLYYIPQCPPPGVQGTDNHGNSVCQGGTWQWIANTANQSGGINYVYKVRNPSGCP